MYSTRDGRMTPTAPTYEDMRIADFFERGPTEEALWKVCQLLWEVTEGDQVRSTANQINYM